MPNSSEIFEKYSSDCPWFKAGYFSNNHYVNADICAATNADCEQDNCAPVFFIESLIQEVDKELEDVYTSKKV